nr:amidase family protein [Mycoplasma suis]
MLSSIPDEAIEGPSDWKKLVSKTLKSTKWSRFFNTLFHSNSPSINYLTYSLKNSIYIKDSQCTGSSSALVNPDHYPPKSSTIHELLSKTKAIHLITSSLDEFGMGAAGVFGHKGRITQPLSPKRVIGGSSSGSAYLLSKKLIDFSIVTDTGGSARVPASYNSLYGFKPSFGLVSREGILPLCTLLDTPSIMAHSVETIAKVLSVISAPDPADLTTIKTVKKSYYPLNIKNPLEALEKLPKNHKNIKKITFVAIKEASEAGNRPFNKREKKIRKEFQRLLGRLRFAPNTTVSVSTIDWPPIYLTELIYKIVAFSELVTHYLSLSGIVNPWIRGDYYEDNISKKKKQEEDSRLKLLKVSTYYSYDSEKIRAKMGSEVKRRHLLGFFFLYGDNRVNIYKKARKIISLYKKRLSELLSRGEIIISPTTEDIAPLSKTYSPIYFKDSFQSLVLLANFCGLPAISIPWLHYKSKLDSSKVFMGLHLISNYREDKYLLSVVSFLEKSGII